MYVFLFKQRTSALLSAVCPACKSRSCRARIQKRLGAELVPVVVLRAKSVVVLATGLIARTRVVPVFIVDGDRTINCDRNRHCDATAGYCIERLSARDADLIQPDHAGQDRHM
jgi:hypothetical protein